MRNFAARWTPDGPESVSDDNPLIKCDGEGCDQTVHLNDEGVRYWTMMADPDTPDYCPACRFEIEQQLEPAFPDKTKLTEEGVR